MSPVQGQANDASSVIKKWSDTAEETEATSRADTSNPRERVKYRVLLLE